MYKGKKILAVITARGGSKRLPNKNILDLGDKPLISWTIDAAKKSKYIDRCIVSTDSDVIASVSKENGADIPFIRPKELSGDHADSVSVLKHAMDTLSGFDYVLLLQPTSPLRTNSDIDSAIEQLNEDTKGVVSVCESEHSPLWANTLPTNLSMKDFLSKNIKNKRSQDLETFYRLNGAIYISEYAYFVKNNGFIGDKTTAYIMSNENSIDIDTQLDFDFANFILENRIQKQRGCK